MIRKGRVISFDRIVVRPFYRHVHARYVAHVCGVHLNVSKDYWNDLLHDDRVQASKVVSLMCIAIEDP